MSDKVAPLKWLTDYIEAVENADVSCEQKLVLPELREVKNLLSIHVGMTEPVCEPVSKSVPTPKIYTLPEILKKSGDLQVIDFLDEFIEKLREQLIADHKRWGNTWLNRPKEGQELRTKARYTDYFDMFEETGEPINWLAVVGNALICWIREQHPELHLDPDGSVCSGHECEDVGKPKEVILHDLMSIKRWKEVAQEARALELHNLVVEKLKDLTPEEVISALDQIRDIIGKDEKVQPKTETTELEEAMPYEVIGIKVSPDGVDDIRIRKSMEPEEIIDEKPVEEMTTKELVESGPAVQHKSDCAVYNEPPVGFASSVSECDCLDHNLSNTKEEPERPFEPVGKHPIMTAVEMVEGRVKGTKQGQLSYSPKNPRDGKKSFAVAHVVGEEILYHNGVLSYSPKNLEEGKLILESIVFRMHQTNCPDKVIGTVDKMGKIIPATCTFGLVGLISPTGSFTVESISVDFDKNGITVSYDYEFYPPAEK